MPAPAPTLRVPWGQHRDTRHQPLPWAPNTFQRWAGEGAWGCAAPWNQRKPSKELGMVVGGLGAAGKGCGRGKGDDRAAVCLGSSLAMLLPAPPAPPKALSHPQARH